MATIPTLSPPASDASTSLGLADDDLVAMAVHDLKTPLTALRQALQVLASGRAGEVSATQARFVAIGLDNTTVLAALLDRMRDLRGAACTTSDLRPSRVPLARCVELVVRALAPSAESAGVRLTTACDDGVPDAWADEDLVRRVVLNLVANAIKYGGSGGHALARVRATHGDGTAGFVSLEVEDRGPGVAEEDLERLFDRWFRCAGPAGRHDGNGLGLAIVREIALAHGGDAAARNNLGRGCTFAVALPAFGSGKGSHAHLARSAATLTGPVELRILSAAAGAAARLADTLASLPRRWGGPIDLGGGHFGLLAPVTSGRGSALQELTEACGLDERMLAAVGAAPAVAESLEPASLIAAARASLQPFPCTDASTRRERR